MKKKKKKNKEKMLPSYYIIVHVTVKDEWNAERKCNFEKKE